jgi:predicted permease
MNPLATYIAKTVPAQLGAGAGLLISGVTVAAGIGIAKAASRCRELSLHSCNKIIGLTSVVANSLLLPLIDSSPSGFSAKAMIVVASVIVGTAVGSSMAAHNIPNNSQDAKKFENSNNRGMLIGTTCGGIIALAGTMTVNPLVGCLAGALTAYSISWKCTANEIAKSKIS